MNWLRDHLPVGPKRHAAVLNRLETTERLLSVREAQRDAGRAVVDALLLVAGQYGDAWTEGKPERVVKAEADMDAVFASAVQWRETGTLGGMAGTGYVAHLMEEAKRAQRRAERTLP
jgi:hypothetical protein